MDSKLSSIIDNPNVDEEFKKLMLKILRDEDKGIYRFKAEYEKHVKEYLEKTQEDGDQND